MMLDTISNPTSSCRYCGSSWSNTCESHEGMCRYLKEKQSWPTWNDNKKLSEWWIEFVIKPETAIKEKSE